MTAMTRADVPASADIVIVGGGMVGVTLGLCLAQQLPQRRVVLLEAATLPALEPGQPLPYTATFDTRNTALSRRTIQAFAELGVWARLQPHATPIHHIHVSDRGHFGFARLDAREEQVESFGQVIENAWLGVVLLAALRACPSVTVCDGVTVTGLVREPERMVVRGHRQGSELTISAPLLIAADGAGSPCREWLGLAARHHDYHQTALVTTVATSLPHEQVAYERFAAEGPIALLPLPDLAGEPAQTRRSLVWALPPAEAERTLALEDAEFLRALQAAFGGRAGRFRRVGRRQAWPLQLMVADQQVVPRAVVLGNAAHSLHPVAGQGFNLCLRDILVLVQQLSAADVAGQDLGELSLLRRYEQARLEDQRQIIRFSDTLVRGFSTSNPVLAVLRNAGLVGFDLLPGAKPALARYAMGLSHV